MRSMHCRKVEVKVKERGRGARSGHEAAEGSKGISGL